MATVVGYDLDGTICRKPVFNKSYTKCNGPERKKRENIRINHCLTCEKVRIPEEKDYVIITGRKPTWAKETYLWLEKNDLSPSKVFFMSGPRTRDTMIEYKSKTINENGIEVYYEDDKAIAKKLQKLCPNTKIVIVDCAEVKYEI